MKTLTLAALVILAMAVNVAHAADTGANTSVDKQPIGKTRAEVIQEMQAARAAGQLGKPDYYPVFEGSWPGTKTAPQQAGK